MLAASSRVTVVSFGNVSRRPLDSSNLFATPQGTAAKFSVVHFPLKRRVSRTPLHSAAAPILNPESERRASQTIGSHLHEVDPSLVNATISCLRSRETLHFLLATLMSVGKERGELHAGRNLVLRFQKGKQSDESGISDDKISKTELGRSIYRAVDQRRPAVIDCSLDLRPFCRFRNAQAYSFTRYDAPKPNRLLR